MVEVDRSPEWSLETPPDPAVERLATELDCPRPLAAVLASRGLTDPGEARDQLAPSIEALHSPWVLPDVEHAVERLEEAIERGESILVYADRDVDGGTAGTILVRLLRDLGARVTTHVPEKYDGFGLHAEPLERFDTVGGDLVVTVDCGTTAQDAVQVAIDRGLDVVLTDHHEPENGLPPALACVNPRRADSGYPNPALAGGGVAYKVGAALVEAVGAGQQAYRREALPLAAVATVGDYMRLTRENRAIVHAGFDRLYDADVPGLVAAAERQGVETIRDLSWSLAPYLNATRGAESEALLLDLLLADAEGDLEGRLDRLQSHRESRRADRREQQAHLERCIRAQTDPQTASILCVETDRYVGGGPMSSVSEAFGKPVITYRERDGGYRGGGRTDPEVDLLALYEDCEEYLKETWGHPGAAGFSVAGEDVDAFETALEAALEHRYDPAELRPRIDIDARLETEEIDGDLPHVLERLGPYGTGNPEPVFLLEDLEIAGIETFGNGDEHAKLSLPGAGLRLVYWDGAGELADSHPPLQWDVVGTLAYDEYADEPAIHVEDYRES